MRKILSSYPPSSSLLVALLGLSFYVGGLVALPWWIKEALTKNSEVLDFLPGVIALAVVALGCRFLSYGLILAFGRRLARQLRIEVFSRLLTSSDQSLVAENLTCLTRDTAFCEALFGPGLLYTVQAILLLLLSSLSMAHLEPRFLFTVLLPWPPLLACLYDFGRRIRKSAYHEQTAKDRLGHETIQSYQALPLIRVWGTQDAALRRFNTENEALLEASSARVLHRGRALFCVSASTSLSLVFLLFYGSYKVSQGSVEVATLASAIALLATSFQPMFLFAWISMLIFRASPSISRLSKILEQPRPREPRRSSSVLTIERQSPLFDLSIRDNLLLGSVEISDDELWQVLSRVGLCRADPRLRSLDARIGPKAHRLSGGEVQQIALARALLRNPKRLILNDALSMIDSKTIDHILTELGKLPMLVFVYTNNPRFSSRSNILVQREAA